jgi:Asp-tRNA(Asn)/Glu-tRNA(Gln) amidotransferase A subunit family amidase
MKPGIKGIYLFIACLASFLLGAAVLSDNNITKDVVEKGDKIIGIDFTEPEIDSMLSILNDQLGNYKNIRKADLQNDVPSAMLFNPIPNDFRVDQEQKPLRFDNYISTKMPVNKDDLAFYSVGQLASLIRTRQISCVELTKFFLDRLKKYGPKLECVITLTEDSALAQAKKDDEEIAAGWYKGMMHGIPFGVKDLLATKGYKTTWGAMPYKDQMIDEDATVIKKLEDAGGILVAKLTMGSLAMGDVWYGGKTRNPWKTSEGSSGSSAGPASAVSAGLVPFAIGTETWGSIVSPSTVCGVTGLRPTYGRVSRTGAMSLSPSMDKIGPICRNAEDCAIVFYFIYGPDKKDKTLYDYPFNYYNKIDLKKLRIGYLKNDFAKDSAFKVQDSLALLTLKQLGADLIPIELPKDIPVNDLSIILTAEAAAEFDNLTLSNKDDMLAAQDKDAWPNIFRAARFIPAVEYINANRLRYKLIQEMADQFQKIDLYVAPSWTGDNLLLTNLTGHPCVVVPDGFSKDGTPTSISFIGNLFDEGTILEVAKAYQEVTDFHLQHPDEFK